MDELKQILSNKKLLINLAILLALAAILPFIIQLLRQSQILKSHASNPGIQVVGPSDYLDTRQSQSYIRPSLDASGNPHYNVEVQLTAPDPTTAP